MFVKGLRHLQSYSSHLKSPEEVKAREDKIISEDLPVEARDVSSKSTDIGYSCASLQVGRMWLVLVLRSWAVTNGQDTPRCFELSFGATLATTRIPHHIR
jgi:hypothetical protein